MICRGECQKLELAALEQGWRVEKTKGNHVRFLSPDGKGLVIVSSTPSNRNAARCALKDFRRAGLNIRL